MRPSLLIIIMACFLWACNNNNKEENADKSAGKQHSPKLSKDSLRILYHQAIEAQIEPLPTKQIIEKNKLYPVDEAPLDTAFFVFREQLKKAVKEKNIFFLMDAIDENIVLDNQISGIGSFAQKWELTSESATLQSPLWPVLDKLLEGGGVFDDFKISFHGPYISATYPNDSPPRQAGVISGAGVRMRSAPSLNSKILKNLSHDLIDILETTSEETTINEETFPWIKIKTKENLEGYVWGKFVEKPINQEIIFKRVKNQWKIIKLIE